MSLAYSAYIATSLSPERVADLTPPSGDPIAGLAKHSAARRHIRAVHPVSQEMFDESYGIRPTVVTAYAVSKTEDPEVGEAQPLTELATLLRTLDGDAYVGYAGLVTALIRRGGTVTLNSAWLDERPWLRPHLAELFGDSYVVEHVPEPE